MAGKSPVAVAGEVQFSGSPLGRIAGLRDRDLGNGLPFLWQSGRLTVGAGALTNVEAFVAPCDLYILSMLLRVIVQQTGSNGTVNFGDSSGATALGAYTLLTTDAAGTLVDVTLGVGGAILEAPRSISRGQQIVYGSATGGGAAGVVSICTVLVPR